MSLAHRRKKQPEIVRQQVLEAAALLALNAGLAGVTLDAVARDAGISKGGLLHHYPSRASLLDGLFDDLTDRFDAAIAEEMLRDPVAHGRFTRAYINAVFGLEARGEAVSWHALTLAILAEPSLRARWRQWVDDKADAYVGTDASVACLTARLAADGVWLAETIASHDLDPALRADIARRLRAMTVD